MIRFRGEILHLGMGFPVLKPGKTFSKVEKQAITKKNICEGLIFLIF